MTNMSLSGIFSFSAVVGLVLSAQVSAQAPAVPDAAAASAMVKVTTLEDAFVKASRRQDALEDYILRQQERLVGAKDEKVIKALQGALENAEQELRNLRVAMRVIFGTGQRRNYVYNQVNSKVYLEVGSLEDIFGRALATRQLLRRYISENVPKLETEKDAGKKSELQTRIESATRYYKVVAASLQLIFNVDTDKEYGYDPRNATIYLKTPPEQMKNPLEQD